MFQIGAAVDVSITQILLTSSKRLLSHSDHELTGRGFPVRGRGIRLVGTAPQRVDTSS